MIAEIPFSAISDNTIVRDYLHRDPSCMRLFTHADITTALASRTKHIFNRTKLHAALTRYHQSFRVHQATTKNLDKIRSPHSIFVTTGQQAGFMGGPLYTLYKIITCIKVARHIEKTHGIPTIPLFWLASEDHDFEEVNRASRINYKGEIETTTFSWEQKGRPLYDLDITKSVRDAWEAFTLPHKNNTHTNTIDEIFSYNGEDNYCHWCNQIWLSLFSHEGLVVIEPQVIAPLANSFFVTAQKKRAEISLALHQRTEKLQEKGYPVSFDPSTAGTLFCFDTDGMRVRLNEKNNTPPYSTDAALRPLLLDSIVPTICHILGPGELTYHAMLKPLYACFKITQPYLQLRESFTIIDAKQSALLKKLRTTPEDIIQYKYSFTDVASHWLQETDKRKYQTILEDVARLQKSLSLFSHTNDMCTPIEKTTKSIDKNIRLFQKRLCNTRLNQASLNPAEIRMILTLLWPQGPQERLLSPYSILSHYGIDFITTLLNLPLPSQANHRIVTF